MEATAATLERRVRVIPATRKPEELHRDHDGKMRVPPAEFLVWVRIVKLRNTFVRRLKNMDLSLKSLNLKHTTATRVLQK